MTVDNGAAAALVLDRKEDEDELSDTEAVVLDCMVIVVDATGEDVLRAEPEEMAVDPVIDEVLVLDCVGDVGILDREGEFDARVVDDSVAMLLDRTGVDEDELGGAAGELLEMSGAPLVLVEVEDPVA